MSWGFIVGFIVYFFGMYRMVDTFGVCGIDVNIILMVMYLGGGMGVYVYIVVFFYFCF